MRQRHDFVEVIAIPKYLKSHTEHEFVLK